MKLSILLSFVTVFCTSCINDYPRDKAPNVVNKSVQTSFKNYIIVEIHPGFIKCPKGQMLLQYKEDKNIASCTTNTDFHRLDTTNTPISKEKSELLTCSAEIKPVDPYTGLCERLEL